MFLVNPRRSFWIPCLVLLCCSVVIAQTKPDCSAKPSVLPSGMSLTISPASANDGTNVSLSVIGKGLEGYGLLLCPSSPSTANSSPVQGSPDPKQKSSDTTLYFQLSFPQGVSDNFSVYLVKGESSYDTTKKFLVGNSDDASYVGCGLGLARVSTNGNLACSFVPLTYDTARRVFGKGIADRFLVVQLTVRNTSKDLEYLFQDVRLGTATLMLGSVDRRLMRGLAETTEQFSNRAIIFRLTAAGATLLTGIAGVVDNNLLTSAAALVAGPAQTGLTGAIPDLTKAELARLDDLGFTTTSTVISKSSSIPVVAFLSFHPFYKKGDYQHLDTDELRGFWSSLQVQVAGVHVQQTDLATPTLKTFLPPTPAITATKKLAQDIKLSVQGTGLTSVTSVSLKPQGGDTAAKANVAAQLQPLPGQSALDNNVDQLVIPAGAELDEGTYNIILGTKDNPVIAASPTLAVGAAAASAAPSAAQPASPAPGTVSTPSVPVQPK